MKTKLTSVTYLGYTAMDRRFSISMLPWVLREIRATETREKLSIAVEDGCLKAYNGNFEPIIIHRLVDILRASQVPGRPNELFYILLNEKEGLLQCYLFKGETVTEVTDLFSQMREPSPGAPSPKGSTVSLNVTRNAGFQQQNGAEHLPWSNPGMSLSSNCSSNLTNESSILVRTVSNASALTSLCADLSPSDSHFFEVLYIGKVRISQRKVPESLIDDALQKFTQHEAEKIKNNRRHSLLSSTGASQDSIDSDMKSSPERAMEQFRHNNLIPSTTPLEPDKSMTWKSAENLQKPENTEIDKEFDVFTKERVEKNIKQPVPLEPTVLVINVPKNNLGTVEEDEEKHDDGHTLTTSHTSKIEPKDALIPNAVKAKNPLKDKSDQTNKQSVVDPLLHVPMEVKNIEPQTDEKLGASMENKTNLNFGELQRKPKETYEEKKRMMSDVKPYLRDRSASIGTLNLKTPLAHLIGEQNRTMLFQVGRSELRLISPDRKQILLHRSFKDVASCVLGRSNKEHFGFVCRETNDYACYVFKCESDSVATEVVNAIKQAFVAHADLIKKSRDKSPNMTCEHCPMLWYHRLCHDIEGMNEKKIHAFILRRIEQLPDDEQEVIITKYQGGTNHMYEVSEHNAFLMMLLRAHCEAKQQRHVHDTAENRSEFLNQYLGGSTIFMKAKRSLSSGFDHLLKRRQSKDDVSPLAIKKEFSPHPSGLDTSSEPSNSELLSPDVQRCKSLSPSVNVGTGEFPFSKTTNQVSFDESTDESKEETSVNSPMMDIFLKVSDSRAAANESGNESDATWRQAIYEKVVQPSKDEGDMQQKNLLGHPTSPTGKRSKEQLRQLWKMAIDQTILLVRMEKENARLKESEESSAVRRIKLEYAEMGSCDAGVSHMWDSLLARDPSRPVARVDRHMLRQAVRQGVPRAARGGVWYFLAAQAALRAAPPDARLFPLYHAPYRSLLAGLTKHQHAILIDLGRTFPKHSYFASALGPGQLALYNILKAYSLLDPDVGYCQGLSFVAGVLLLHMDEAEAFVLLRHLMFRRGIRKQYLPDMSALQVQLYQLSRLLRDHEPELHAKLEALDISPALYAAPWMLTLFTSQFPLGFVVRVFDLIFLESFDVVFAVSLALLAAHRDGLLLCESCEEAAEYLKHKLPDLDQHLYERVMATVSKLDISRQLTEYAVEYSVLREEMPRLATLTEHNRQLQEDTSRMSTELDSAMDAIENYQKTQTRLEAQNKIMEQHLTFLSRYISAHHRQDLPHEIKKIVQNYSKKISFGSKIITKFTSNDEENEYKKNYKQGASTPNLFSKTTKEEVMNVVNKERNIEDRKQFMMKKSQSVHSGLISNKHFPLKVLEEKKEDVRRRDSLRIENLANDNIRDLGRKTSGFFANTHEQIRQERFFEQQLKHDFDENLKKLDEKLSKKLSPKSYKDDLSIFQSKKSMSLNLNPNTKGQDSKLNDSGFVTPLSPENNRKDDNSSTISHPLSDCDVDIKFDGQLTKLKQIRPLKNNN
ncbi:TBC1 domain family member 1-like isoform X1 [Nymphalis io]|uniref:TBC1 domain family member 1-like isoform X1 n=2 Tax=Inachis io TaxID=171585 RepID=UPI0021677AB9|nr:TBC1 domain family member 1-like isoform X1 [Nymphalis io]